MDGTDLMLLGLGVIVAPLVALIFLAGGPLLWFGLGLALVVAGILVTVLSPEDAEEHVRPRNCPNCGSPNDPDAAACSHCDSPL
ncbi:zinc ribbon domain-containing protein [Halostella sp. PRR32]|uniref:zinc ribbon domain-containing protein n=1 Tax=Halostella sp. PRR32 TaxID=3098147 RepID=UPI002B1DDC16|nr:zinc ribbon domain-containing protein [Halostella sp. PRR32]